MAAQRVRSIGRLVLTPLLAVLVRHQPAHAASFIVTTTQDAPYPRVPSPHRARPGARCASGSVRSRRGESQSWRAPRGNPLRGAFLREAYCSTGLAVLRVVAPR